MHGIQVYLIFFLVYLKSCYCTHRTLQSWVNFGCGDTCDGKNITTVYLRAEGLNDTLHYLWDFYGNPTILLAITSPNAWVNITWEDFLRKKENSVSFTETPKYSIGVAIRKIMEFNDVNDTALLPSDTTYVNILHPRHFHWRRKPLVRTKELVQLEIVGHSYRDTDRNITRGGAVKFSLVGFCSIDHSAIVPHMLHTENSTQVDIIIDQLETNASYSNSRFAMELVIVSENMSNLTMDTKKSLDDEHTPGIFEVVELKTTGKPSSYLQWRPVSYTDPTRLVTSSTETVHYPLANPVDKVEAIENSLLFNYYGRRIKDLVVQHMNISIGSKDDGYYKKTKYLTWTFILGYGNPPDEKLSYLVIMIISIGIGLPLLIMTSGALYACMRKLPKRYSNMYGPQ